MLVTKFNASIDIILKILEQSKELEEEDKKNTQEKLRIDRLKDLLDKLKEENKVLLNDLLEELPLPSNIDTMISRLEDLKIDGKIDFTDIDNKINQIENILDELYKLLDSFLLDEHPQQEYFETLLAKIEEYAKSKEISKS